VSPSIMSVTRKPIGVGELSAGGEGYYVWNNTGDWAILRNRAGTNPPRSSKRSTYPPAAFSLYINRVASSRPARP